jgi:hypothetical protein
METGLWEQIEIRGGCPTTSYRTVWLDFNLAPYTTQIVLTGNISRFDTGLITGSYEAGVDYMKLIKKIHSFITKLEK